MSKKERKKRTEGERTRLRLNPLSNLKESTIQSVWGIVLFVLCLFFLLAAFGKGGRVGTTIYSWFDTILGLGYYLLPVLLIILSASFFGDGNRKFSISKILGSLLFIVSGLAILDIVKTGSGGILGNFLSAPLVSMFDIALSSIVLGAGLIIGVMVILDVAPHRDHLLFWRKKNIDGEAVDNLDENGLSKDKLMKKMLITNGDGESEEDDESVVKRTSVLDKLKDRVDSAPQNKGNYDPDFVPLFAKKTALLGKQYIAPPLNLLESDSGKPGAGDIKANANIIKRTLQNFGIDVEMDEISIGPSVTRYSMKPAEGVKLSKILGLQNNLSLALAAHPLRIEAPIPGKSLVGIEIPNTVKAKVTLGSLLAMEEFQKSDKPLLVALGRGVSGKSHYDNLAKMPHLLIAGATGSGKSVTAHTILTSLLYRNSPENLRFIMIDPKRVELTQYNGIPHLITPVITDAKKAIMALRWAAKEMDRRYDLLEKSAVRDIDSYHKNILMPALESKKKGGNKEEQEKVVDPLPYIVVIIDELADIMQAYPRELEAGIVRLAQMSRAVGIHLILSTQRPSVNVITGLIKANVPARIALQVASQIDSRTILDMRGAEELLGAGDMLYLSGEMSSPRRIQSAYVTETETKKIVKHLKDQANSLGDDLLLVGGEKNEGVNDPIFNNADTGGNQTGRFGGGSGGFDGDDDDDDLYDEAKAMVMEAGKASTSYLQRKLRVGYARAARIVDLLEARGVVGPGGGSKPREIIGYSGGSGSPDNAGNDSEENTSAN